MGKSNAVRLVHVEPPFIGDGAETLVIGLARYGLDGQEEEIWVDPGESGEARVSSIPFCVDGLSLFDVITTDRGSGIIEIIENSNRGVLRVLVDRRVEIEVRAEVAARLSEFFIGMKLAHEWNGMGFVVVDVPSKKIALEVEAHIKAWNNIFWEWGAVCAGP